jgi:hypothetical protein
MQGWINVNMTVSDYGTRCSIGCWRGKEHNQAELVWQHEVRVSDDTEIPDGQDDVISSTMARAVSRYFEDRLIENLRASVSNPNVAEE